MRNSKDYPDRWYWERGCIGSFAECKEKLNYYRFHAHVDERYILVQELTSTTPMLNGPMRMYQLTVIEGCGL